MGPDQSWTSTPCAACGKLITKIVVWSVSDLMSSLELKEWRREKNITILFSLSLCVCVFFLLYKFTDSNYLQLHAARVNNTQTTMLQKNGTRFFERARTDDAWKQTKGICHVSGTKSRGPFEGSRSRT
jgi:hypothetical protein